MIELVGVKALEKIADVMLERFGKSVIERWSRYRAKNFIEAFFSAVVQGRNAEEIESLLNEIFDSDSKTEALFEAYRAVSLARSKEVGPRAIGLLTAQIVSENRAATAVEEYWFDIYETFSDMELFETRDFYADCFLKARDEKRKDYTFKGQELVVEWSNETTEFKANVDRSPFNLHECLGSWAGRLANSGLINTRIAEDVWDYDEDSERHIDEPGTARKTTYWIHLNQIDEKYAALIEKAIPKTMKEKQEKNK